jgi:Domain of unknown function (DUF4234)
VAEEVQITGTESQAKIRNPLAPALLPFATFGIYTLVWYFRINKELAAMGRARNTEELGTSPVTSLMAIMFGWIIIVPPFLSFYNTWKRAAAAQRLFGVQGGFDPGLGFLLTIFVSPVGHYLLQRDMNSVVNAQAGSSPQGAIPSAAAPPAGAGEQPAAPPAPAQPAPEPPAPGESSPPQPPPEQPPPGA